MPHKRDRRPRKKKENVEAEALFQQTMGKSSPHFGNARNPAGWKEGIYTPEHITETPKELEDKGKTSTAARERGLWSGYGAALPVPAPPHQEQL